MTFVPEASLIALREGLEALLITGILLGLVTKLGRPDARKLVWFGFVAAALASAALGFVVQKFLLEPFENQGGAEWFELGAVIVAVIILTYMVFWMWQHTRGIMSTMRDQVQTALTKGALFGVIALTFASVIREGLEVVLFYGALAGRYAAVDLAWSGAVGFVASAVIVYAILKGAAKVDLQKFFGITGILLIFIAAGLLVHGVYAATSLGLIAPAPRIWDTSAFLSEDGATGRILHALVGYAATPTLLQASLYFGYVFGFGGWYLWSLGAFTRRTPVGKQTRRAPLGAALVALFLVVGGVSYGAATPGELVSGHAHSSEEEHSAMIPAGEKVGVLLRSHGEPVHYNESTYRSFADFMKNLFTTLGMENLLLIDQGTVLLDQAHPHEKGLRLDAKLMDAWTHDYALPAAYVGSPVPQAQQAPLFDGFYLAPGVGPGVGEPDILEMAGLSAYQEWLLMNGTSPMHETKLKVLEATQRQLRALYGDAIVIQQSYHILPKVGARESDEEAAAAFKAAGVTRVIDAYTTTVFSDVMNTCMMVPHMLHAFESAGYSGKIDHAQMAGGTHAYAHGVSMRVQELLARTNDGDSVAVFLTHHGSSPQSKSPCGDKNADEYHANAKHLYERALAALAEDVTRPNVRYYQVYGQGAGAADDGVLSPTEALEQARRDGATRVIDVPFELTGNGFDNLVAQRASYGLDPHDAPWYDANHETRLTIRGLDVLITSADFGAEAKASALVEVIRDAIAGHVDDDGHAH